MLRHLHQIALPALVALGACSTTPAPFAFEGIAPRLEAPPPVGATGGERPGHLQVLAGTWGFQDSDLDPHNRQFAGGLTFSYKNPGKFLGFEAGLNQCFDGNGFGKLEITELFFGARKTFQPDHALQPYLGAGLALDFASSEIRGFGIDASDDDISPAAYAHAGVRYCFTDTFGVGLDARIVRGTDVELPGTDGDVDYEQLGLFFDYRF